MGTHVDSYMALHHEVKALAAVTEGKWRTQLHIQINAFSSCSLVILKKDIQCNDVAYKDHGYSGNIDMPWLFEYRFWKSKCFCYKLISALINLPMIIRSKNEIIAVLFCSNFL